MTIFLETKRLILKKHELSDFDDLLALCSDPDVMKYIGDGSVYTAEQVKRFLSTVIPYQEKHGIGFCMVYEKDSGHFIGQAGLFHLGYSDTQPEIEVAYRLHKKFWGKGYATELVKALIHWGFQHLPVDKFIAVADPENIASQNVLRKAGLDCTGKMKWSDGRELFWYVIYKADSIELVPYDVQWPKVAELEIKKLAEVLPKNHIIDMQHVGSTAIPGMLSKPIIDIQIAVDSLIVFKPIAIDALKRLGYEYWAENPDPERMFFVKGMPPFGDKRTHHVHIVEPNSRHWKGKILFRDYLTSHPQVVHEYAILKKKLACEHLYDREKYTAEKTEFVTTILKTAEENYKNNKPLLNIIFLTGACGAGKTTLLNAFSEKEKTIPCFHFDSIGIPSENEMIKIYGSGNEWQKAMTYHWVKELITRHQHKKLVILEGQVNLDFIIAACEGLNFYQYKIIFVHCENHVRHTRLNESRNQPELINDTMDSWADYLKKQAIDKKTMILDTSFMDSDEMVSQFKKLIGLDDFGKNK